MPRRPRWLDVSAQTHGHRAVWVAYAAAIAIAALVHAGKAADDRGAFIRWRHQLLEFRNGKNIWDDYQFPNPPIMALTLQPLMALPPVIGAVAWFVLKAALAAGALYLCLRMARPAGRSIPFWAVGLVIALSFRPILSDLHHANNNLLIMFLVVAALALWRRGWDVAAGLALALAISYKVTPALFLPYFLYRRSYRTVGATLLGIGVFLLIVPSLFLGPQFNGECLAMWYHRILRPYVASGVTGDADINQSMVGVLTRLLTRAKDGKYGPQFDVNFVAWPPLLVNRMVKALSLGLVALLAWTCRTRATRRDDARLLGEFALVVLTMLFVSERSWKHHYVTVVLPYAYLVCRMAVAPAAPRVRAALGACLALSTLLMATTSSEVGGLFAHGQGHKLAQAYGMFLWAGVTLYLGTAWRVVAEARRPAGPADVADGPAAPSIYAPHVLGARAPARRTS